MEIFDIIKHRLSTYKVKDAKKETVFSELESLLSSGLDFSRSFELLISGETEDKMKAILSNLYQDIVGGVLLWQSMERNGHFDNLDYGVVRIGEETGRLNESLGFLSSYYKKKIEQRRMVGAAVRYPLVILCVAIVVVIFMLAVVVPMFSEVYARMGGELPGLTQWIISVSHVFPVYAVVFVLLILITGMILSVFKESRTVRSSLSAIVLKIPVANDIIKKNHQAHFCKLLSLLTGSGVPLLHGTEMLGSIITFYPYQQSFNTINEGLRNGELLSENLGKYPKLYDNKLVALIRVGEETNRLPEMFTKQSVELTRELEFRIQKLGSLLEPLLIIVIGVLVAVILVSMYMPMFSLGGIMG